MYRVIVECDGKPLHEFKCEAVCSSYLESDEIKSCVCVSPSTDVSNLPLMACACSSSCLSVIMECQSANAPSFDASLYEDAAEKAQGPINLVRRVK